MTARPLSAAGRAWAIERVLNTYYDDYVGEVARSSPTESAAIVAVREVVGHFSIVATGYWLSTWSGKIEVEYPDGTAGIVTWREVVQAARATATQLVLL